MLLLEIRTSWAGLKTHTGVFELAKFVRALESLMLSRDAP